MDNDPRPGHDAGHDPVGDAGAAIEVLGAAADAVLASLQGHTEWRLADDGVHAGQYTHDQLADVAVLDVLQGAGFAVLSEESGFHAGARPVTVVVDPVDGSTNAARGLPWWATSLCAVDAEGAWVALVADHASGRRWSAIRGGGAFRDGVPFRRPTTPALADAVIGFDGLPPFHFGWWQFRTFGAMALDLCAVADGRLDGFIPCLDAGVAEWDYLGGVLVCREAGAPVVDLHGRDLVALDHEARRIPCAAGDEVLLEQLVAARRRFHRDVP